MKQYKISIEFNNNPGFVIRMALVLERRSYEIQSLQIVTDKNNNSHMSLQIAGDPAKYEQVLKQLSKLIDVIAIKELPVARVTTRTVSKEEALVFAQA